MDQQAIREWISKKLKERGRGARRDLAIHMNVTQDKITRMLNGKAGKEQRRIEASELRLIGDFLGSLPPGFIPATGDDTPPIDAPLISWVSAGAIKRPEHVADFADAKRVTAPGLDPNGEWIALQVEGDSMDRISPPESVIFVNVRDKKLVSNACYVISDEGGEATYKRYRADPPRWEPVSENRTHEPYFVKNGQGPRIVGRVRRTTLDL